MSRIYMRKPNINAKTYCIANNAITTKKINIFVRSNEMSIVNKWNAIHKEISFHSMSINKVFNDGENDAERDEVY